MDFLFLIIVILLCFVNVANWIFFSNLKKNFKIIKNDLEKIDFFKEKILSNEKYIKKMIIQIEAQNKTISNIFKIETESTKTIVELINLIKNIKRENNE